MSIKSQPKLVAIGIAAATIFHAFVLLIGQKYYKLPINGGDGVIYLQLAVNMVRHGHFSVAQQPPFIETVYRSPGYPLFIAAVHLLTGSFLLGVRAFQLILVGLTAWFIFRISERYVHPLAAASAGVLCAFYPPFAAYAVYHVTETLSAFLLVLLVWLLTRPDERYAPLLTAAVSGLIVGVAAQVRPSLLPLVALPMLVLWHRSGRIKGVYAAVVVALCAALCIVPWTVRNYMISGRVIPLSTVSGANLLMSEMQYSGELSYAMQPKDWLTLGQHPGMDDLQNGPAAIEYRLDRGFAAEARAGFSRIPLHKLLLNIPVRVWYLWATALWRSPEDALTSRLLSQTANELTHLVTMVLALAGFWLARARLKSMWLLWIIPLYLTVLHLIFAVEGRFTVPARPFLMVFAGVATAYLIEAISKRLSKVDRTRVKA